MTDHHLQDSTWIECCLPVWLHLLCSTSHYATVTLALCLIYEFTKYIFAWGHFPSLFPLPRTSCHHIFTKLATSCHLSQFKYHLLRETFSSVQFSHSVVSSSLQPHELQHARPPCPSPTPGVHSDSRPSSQWCHPAISSSVIPFSSCPQSLPASESFPMSQLFAWGGQSTGVSALASFLPKKSQADLQNGLVGSSCSPRDSQESSPTPQFKSINSLALSCIHSPTLTSIHDYWKNHSFE